MYSYRFSFGKGKQKECDFITEGFWHPRLNEWRDIVEDYLYISRKRKDNKLSMFKLQLNILEDIIKNCKYITEYKKRLNEINIGIEKNKDKKTNYHLDIERIESEVYTLKHLNRILKEIVDGIVWRSFNFNRAILYLLADKDPIEHLNVDEGLISSIYEFSDIFLNQEQFAVLNDISNFIRVGDITVINKDGNIEFIEVKSGKKKGAMKKNPRVRRQKKYMEELGVGEYDGKKLKILDSKTRQVNHLSLLKESIQKARAKGQNSELIGNYMVIHVIDYEKINNPESIISYINSRHKSVKQKWDSKNDFYFVFNFSEKLIFSRNYVPISIFPFDVETCADILMGKLAIFAILNFSEIKRMFEKYGWEVVDSILDRIKEENYDTIADFARRCSFKIRKGGLTIVIPPNSIGRIPFEMLSPKAILVELDKMYDEGENIDCSSRFWNYLDDQKIWI
jgi:hypothetical protein